MIRGYEARRRAQKGTLPCKSFIPKNLDLLEKLVPHERVHDLIPVRPHHPRAQTAPVAPQQQVQQVHVHNGQFHVHNGQPISVRVVRQPAPSRPHTQQARAQVECRGLIRHPSIINAQRNQAQGQACPRARVPAVHIPRVPIHQPSSIPVLTTNVPENVRQQLRVQQEAQQAQQTQLLDQLRRAGSVRHW